MYTNDKINRAFLKWLSKQPHQPDPLEFLADLDGTTLMPPALEQLVASLYGLGLVRCCDWREERRLPRRIELSPRGWECVRAFDADIAAWASPPTGQST